ncbi:MAG: hypothetical protein HFJ28_00760 [Clostridia bacterium]|nr:hypothetical protein [Clostridia bacterium]
MEYLKQLLKKTGWISIVESLIFAVLGIILICNPEGTVNTISIILGIIFIVIGIFKIIQYIAAKQKDNNYDLIYGLTAIVIGIVAMMYMSTITSIFRIIIGVWIVYTSFVRINSAIQLRKLNGNIWIYSLILAILMTICGLYVIINTGAIIVTIGAIMLVYSIIDIIESIIFMKNIKEVL